MRKFTENIYWIFLIVIVSLILQVLFRFQINIDNIEPETGYVTLSDYQVETITDHDTPQGIRQRYTLTLDPCESLFCHLVFYSVHQEVEVYIDETSVYSLTVDRNNPFGHTPGSIWNILQLNEANLSKEIQVDLIPVYNSAIDNIPTFYYGERPDIIRSLIIHDLPAFFLSTIAILAGIFYICFILYAYKKGHADNNLIMLGVFAIMVGLWKLSDMEIFSLLVNGNLIASYLPLFTLMLACVPYNLFIRNLHSTREHWAWYIPCVICYTTIILQIALQMLHIADLRETLFITHISIFAMVFVIIIMMIYEIRKFGLNKRLKRNVICILGCIVGLVIDTIIYYVTNAQGTLLCGIIGFVIYIFVLGFTSMYEIRKLIAIGQKAKKYRQLAYHDEMTGLLNRTAYVDYIRKVDFSPEHMIVAMFDLNDLKKCNDEFGHDQGDIYIITCAKLISDCFADIGNCYRIGGDEFCVLIKDVSLDLCKDRVTMFYNKVEQENKRQELAMEMKVACGCALYDKQLDYDIQGTIRRADKMMYKEKYSMKQQKKIS